MALTHLTLIQRCNIHDLEWPGGKRTRTRRGAEQIGFAGIDRLDRPVIWFVDAVGEKVIAWTREGPGRDPEWPLRDFTDAELGALPEDDAELLFGLPYMVGQIRKPPEGVS